MQIGWLQIIWNFHFVFVLFLHAYIVQQTAQVVSAYPAIHRSHFILFV